MKKAFALPVIFAVALCVVLGCGKPSAPTTSQESAPSTEEVKAYVSSQVPATVTLAEFHVLGIRRDGEAWRVQFDGVLTPYAPLFLPVNLDAELARLQWHPKKPVADASKPKLIRQFDRIATTGELRARNASGWQFEVSQWDIKELNFGQPRNQFPTEALLLGAAPAQDPLFRYLQRGQFMTLELRSRVIYTNVTLDALDLDSLVMSHSRGMGSVKLDDLLPGLQAFFYLAPSSEVIRERQARQVANEQVRRQEAQAQQLAETQVQRAEEMQARQEEAMQKRKAAQKCDEPSYNAKEIIKARIERETGADGVMVSIKPPALYEGHHKAWRLEFSYSYHTWSMQNGIKSHRMDKDGTSYAYFCGNELGMMEPVKPRQ